MKSYKFLVAFLCGLFVCVIFAFRTVPNNNRSDLRLEIFVKAIDKEGIVEPLLSPWKLQGKVLHHFKEYSESIDINISNWLEGNQGKVLKAVLHFTNDTTISERLPLPLLSDVVVHNKNGKKQAVAFYFINELIVRMEGKSNEIDIAPGETVELLYYIPIFQGEAKLDVKGYGTYNILAK